jgi:D-sedoheptulose 7-phosphate isomerase
MCNKEILSNYSKQVTDAIMGTDFSVLSDIAEALYSVKNTNSVIYTAGNGGSAATASHICNDLLKGCGVCGHTGFKTECLSDSTAVITCLANDFDYESVYSIQLDAKAVKGDLFIVYSGSGNSGNIIKAVNLAKERGLKVIGFTGRDGGKLAPHCDLYIIAPTDNMEQIEDLHMFYTHALSYTLQRKLSEKYTNVKFVKADVDVLSPLAARYGVNSIPNLVLFKNGEKVNQGVGFMPESKVAELIDKAA